jgi:hypothetical protein
VFPPPVALGFIPFRQKCASSNGLDTGDDRAATVGVEAFNARRGDWYRLGKMTPDSVFLLVFDSVGDSNMARERAIRSFNVTLVKGFSKELLRMRAPGTLLSPLVLSLTRRDCDIASTRRADFAARPEVGVVARCLAEVGVVARTRPEVGVTARCRDDVGVVARLLVWETTGVEERRCDGDFDACLETGCD